MGLFKFIQEAGEKLFGFSKTTRTGSASLPLTDITHDSAPTITSPDRAAGVAIVRHLRAMGLDIPGLDAQYDSASKTVVLTGMAPDQAIREKLVLSCGNVCGVSQVNDLITVTQPAPESLLYTVVSGDNLSRISKQFYGTPNKFQLIFEANKPMLSHPDKIYPGQVLRIPPQ